MLKTLSALAVAALVATAPAAARAKAEPAPAPTEASLKAKTQRYCVVSDVTGSRIPQRACKTRDEWLAQGFDPAAK